jgi:hypothetical protein
LIWQAGTALKQREQNRKGGEGNVHSSEDPIIGRDTDAAKPRGRSAVRASAEGAGREAAKGRAVSPVCRSGGRWRDRLADAQPRPRYIPRSNPRVRSCEERDGA